jgi:hypothetical protein
MAASSNNKQIKSNANIKPKERTDDFMKNLLSGLDDENEIKPSDKNIQKKSFLNELNANSSTASANKNSYRLNPNFLPEFDKKLNNFQSSNSKNSTE